MRESFIKCEKLVEKETYMFLFINILYRINTRQCKFVLQKSWNILRLTLHYQSEGFTNKFYYRFKLQ